MLQRTEEILGGAWRHSIRLVIGGNRARTPMTRGGSYRLSGFSNLQKVATLSDTYGHAKTGTSSEHGCDQRPEGEGPHLRGPLQRQCGIRSHPGSVAGT